MEIMKHSILGKIEKGPGFDGVAKVRLGDREVEINLDRDGHEFEVVVNLAAEVVACLAEIDVQARRVAAAELCETYNGGWNEYDEAQGDGTFKAVSNPELTEVEFMAKLSLDTISVTGAQMLTFFYNDQNMFWGHAVIVTSPTGIDMREAGASLFG